MDDTVTFLASSPIFQSLPPEQIEEIAPLFRCESHPAGTIILHQGGHSQAVYFIRSGRLAARIRRGDSRETVAYLQPPDIFGELSFITGRACVCDVEVDVDAEVLLLPKEAMAKLPKQREGILRSLMAVIAGRLQQTVTQGAKTAELPVVLLRNHPHWEAPHSFAAELASSLARQTGRETLLANLGADEEGGIRSFDDRTSSCDVPAQVRDSNCRSQIAQRLSVWKSKFENVILNPVGPDGMALAEIAEPLVNWQGDLLGPGDPIPSETGPFRFVLQNAVSPTLPTLSGCQQLVSEVSESESAYRAGRPVSPRFRRTVDSMARCIAGLQVGLALGGGAAWGWAHIGVLSVLEGAGLPIDMVSGCSMGSVIGALRCAGVTGTQLEEIANYWKTRTRRFIEWRLWRMSLLNERRVRATFRQYFGDRSVNQTEIPYWANAVDIKTGKEFTIQSGSLVDCVRASIALPGLISPFTSNSHLLVDAGIMDPVPVRLVRRMGCHFAIGINAMAALESQEINARYPFNAFDIMTRCMFVMGHEIGQARAEQSADVVFTPALGDITMLQFSRSQEIIDCGRRAAEEHLPAILASYDRLKTRSSSERSQP
ncbi:MAG: patatin-like phospholipase family protein [Acidobacteria bacterium]|nr:patatin-like phospholipase family protein [Acidobacteriota bacterium]